MKRLAITFALVVFALSAHGANFPFIRLNQKTNVISDNGSALTFNGLPIGGVEGSWYSYTTPDGEGGTIYGTALTNALGTNAVNFAVNNLSNFWGYPSVIASIGFPPFNVASVAVSNVNVYGIGESIFDGASFNNHAIHVYGIGDYALANATFDTSGLGDSSVQHIFAVGRQPGKSSVFQGASDVYLWGAIMGQFMQVTNSTQVYGNGDGVLNNALITDSIDVFGWGDSVLQSSAINGCFDIHFNGHAAGTGIAITNSRAIYAFGGGLKSAVLNNSKRVVALGENTGDSISGAYTNVVLVGDGATIGANGQDRLILGPSMSITTGDPGSGLGEWKLGKVVTGATVALTITNYVEVTINGVVKKLALVQ